jgi:hypothetical protein
MRIKEIEMRNNFQSLKENQNTKTFKVSGDTLSTYRALLTSAGFELLEIWSDQKQNACELWGNSASEITIRLDVVSKTATASQQPDNCDALMSEIIDVWLEFRKLRKVFEYKDEELLLPNPPSPMELFTAKCREFKQERDEDPKAWAFIVSPDCDETILSYYELDAEARNAITH